MAKLRDIIHDKLGLVKSDQPTQCMSLDNIPQVAKLCKITGRSYLLCWDGDD